MEKTSVEWLRNCSTNVVAAQDFLKGLRYSIWWLKEQNITKSTTETTSMLHAVVKDLRKHNVLCAIVNEELYTFGTTTDTVTHPFSKMLEAHAHEVKLGSKDAGVVKDDLKNVVGNDPSGVTIKDVVFQAIEAAINFHLTRHSGERTVKIEHWT
ncbi:hypothetical protein E9104_22485, partial [Salmonella enterica subsp. enterica serovar Goldcoast]|uniref:hypothetical protein n=1 Tax=Salmonella enterica TaxID=28901 RepID=UPI001122494F